MTRAFAEACRIENGFDGIPVPGRTDTIILADAVAKWGLDGGAEFVGAFQQVYYRCLSEELSSLSPDARGVLPGVVPLLERLNAHPQFSVGLLTGNYAASAELKLGRFGLWGHFAFGAFGGDAADRNRLVPIAIERAIGAGRPRVASADVVVVGDTPLDVACGQVNGARALAVATGSYAVRELEQAGADLAVEDLSDTAAILAWLSATRGPCE
jgi:phosphoglycolate phosphatase-like HAD superfamily hydrolase